VEAEAMSGRIFVTDQASRLPTAAGTTRPPL